MTIEVLYIAHCPHHQPALARVHAAIEEAGLPATVVEVRVHDRAEAERLHFLGSPSVLIDGWDVEPAARHSPLFAFACRSYCNGGAREGMPSVKLIRTAICAAHRGID